MTGPAPRITIGRTEDVQIFPLYETPSPRLAKGMIDVLTNALAAAAWSQQHRPGEAWCVLQAVGLETGHPWTVVILDYDKMPEPAQVEILAISNAYQAGWKEGLLSRDDHGLDVPPGSYDMLTEVLTSGRSYVLAVPTGMTPDERTEVLEGLSEIESVIDGIENDAEPS